MGYSPAGGWPPPLESPARRHIRLIVGLVTGLTVCVLGAIGATSGWILYTVDNEEPESAAEATTPPQGSPDGPTGSPEDEGTAQAEEGSAVPSDFAGRWEGRMEQSAPDGEPTSEWDLVIELEEGQPFGDGQLFEPDGTHMCDWELTVVDAQEDELEITVLATDGAGTCVSTVDLRLEPDGPELAAYVEAPWPQGLSTATGHLERQQ